MNDASSGMPRRRTIGTIRMLKTSAYCKVLRDSAWILFAALILAAVCTLITYPGVWYSDSYARVGLASSIWDNLKASFRGASTTHLSSWLTVVPSLFMAASKALSGSMALYTLFQAFSFFSVSLLFIKLLAKRWKPLQYALFVVCPLFYGASVYYEAGVGCATAMMVLLLVFFGSDREKNAFDRFCDILLLAGASFVAFGYRANALTIAPIVIVYAFVFFRGPVWKCVSAGAIAFGLAASLAAPMLLSIETLSSSSAGLVWEILETIKSLDDDERDRYADYLDDVGGPGSTMLALEASTDGTVNPFMGTPLNRSALSAEGASALVVSRSFQLASEHPTEFLSNKLKFACMTMGITRPVANVEYNYDRWDRMAEFQFNDSSARHRFVDAYINFNERAWLLRCPWIVFLVCLALLVLEHAIPQIGFRQCSCIFLVAMFYYGAYLVNTQAFELRYFYPSLILLVLMGSAIILNHLALVMDSARNVHVRK